MIFTRKPKVPLLKGGLSRSMGCTPRDWNSNSYFPLPPSLSLLRCFQSAVSLVSLGTEEPLFLSVCLCPAIPSSKWMSVFANSAYKCCFSPPRPSRPSTRL